MAERSRLQNMVRELINETLESIGLIETNNTLTQATNALITATNALITASNVLLTNTQAILTTIRDQHNDPIDGFKARITSEHSHIHEGHMFSAVAVDTVMDDAATLIIAFRTGVNSSHIIIDWDALVAGHLEVFEGATWDAATGTRFVIINRNRPLSAATSRVEGNQTGAFVANEININPTNLGALTSVIELDYSFGTKQSGVGKERGQHELILDPTTTYLIRMTADGNNNSGFIKLVWYEED